MEGGVDGGMAWLVLWREGLIGGRMDEGWMKEGR